MKGRTYRKLETGTDLVSYSPLIVPVVCVFGLLIAIPVGLARGAFGGRACLTIGGLVLGGLALVWIVLAGGESAQKKWESGQQFVTLGDEARALPPGSLEPLRREVIRLAHERLLEGLAQQEARRMRALVERHVAVIKGLPFGRSVLGTLRPELLALNPERALGALDAEFRKSIPQLVEFSREVGEGNLARQLRGKLVELYVDGLLDGAAAGSAIELLRRRCRFIIIGDGEADPRMHFNGLATLIRTALSDLGVHIEPIDGRRVLRRGPV